MSKSRGSDRVRTRRTLPVVVLTLVTLGSGIVNLLSVIGPPPPARRALLREVFPLLFLHASQFLSLLIGFALVVASLNIYRRKRRAYEIVLVLACASVVFHLTKGLDYVEAAFSAALAILLWLNRSVFTVRSSVPEWRAAALGLGAALVVAVGYGVAGFWFLEPRHFGLNFPIGESARRTLAVLTFSDPGIVAQTRYARWFLDSLHLMTATAIAYSAFALFRPALYALRIHPAELELVRKIAARHGRSAQDFFKTWPDKTFHFSPSRLTFIAYGVGRGFAVALGDPVGPEREIEATLRGFLEYCREHGWGAGFHQVLPDFLPTYLRLGLKKLKIGDEAIVDLKNFTLEGKKGRQYRKVTQLESIGIGAKMYEPPLDQRLLARLEEISDDWLRIARRRERRFTLGRWDEHYVSTTPVLVAEDASGRALAFVNVIPSYRAGETTCDLTRRRIEAPNGIMDYLFVKLFLMQRERGFTRFNFGLAPMSGFQEHEEASPQERAVHTFFQQLNFIFSYKGLRAYKAKFATSWEPRYAIYRNVLDLPRLARALGSLSEIEDDR